MDLNLKGKTVCITGGTAGIGLAAAKSFLAEGANVALCGRSEERLAQALAELAPLGGSVFARAVDAADSAALRGFIRDSAEHFDALDILVCNAGCGSGVPLTKTDKAEWDRVFDLNVCAVWEGVQAALPYLEKRGGCVIVTTSFQAKMPFTSTGIYAVSKAAAESMVQVLASELAASGIRVVGVRPGMIDTELNAGLKAAYGEKALSTTMCLQRMGKPGEIADTIVFLSSERASYTTGVTVEVSGGKLVVQDPGYSYAIRQSR